MSDELKPGEYNAADGTRRLFRVMDGDVLSVQPTRLSEMACRLFPEADLHEVIRALVALAEERETRVVELGDYRIVIAPHGRTLEYYYDGTWRKSVSPNRSLVIAAYDARKAARDE